MIHPTAIIDPKADIDSNVDVGPHSIIGENVLVEKGFGGLPEFARASSTSLFDHSG